MTRPPWHLREHEAFRQLERAVEDEFPSLYFEERNGALVLVGEFQIVEGGRVLDLYDIEVEIPRDGPTTGIPVVREVGGRLARSPDNHINPDGSACLAVPDEFWYRNPEGLDLIAFLRGPVLNFFVGQSIVAAGGEWPHGERAHGTAGVVEFYGSLLGTTDPGRVRAFLSMAAAKTLRAHWRCPCGSGQRVAVCHRAVLERLRERLSRPALSAAAKSMKHLRPTRTSSTT